MALIYHDPRFLEHHTGSHPESPARLAHTLSHLQRHGILARLTPGEIVAATREQVAAVHEPAYLDALARAAALGGGRIEADTVISSRSFEVALLAAGAALGAVDQVLAGPHRQAFCLIRPPGHHALRESAMGFCLLNNVAIAATHALWKHGLSRVLIVDWDVHHGNGTQDLFYDSPQVYFFSAHRFPFYPGTGAADETGTGAGLGTTFNLPLPFGTPRAEYRAKFESMLTEAAVRCRPELVLVSAGFDAHRADPIGNLGLETEDFAVLTRLVMQVAEQYSAGRLVSLLEGGYNLQALAESVQCHLETLVPAPASP
jgi:acetoin utilization deacetylase AcuC-like enzyme